MTTRKVKYTFFNADALRSFWNYVAYHSATITTQLLPNEFGIIIEFNETILLKEFLFHSEANAWSFDEFEVIR